MTSKCSGMQKILNGFLRYRSKLRGQLLKQFEIVSDHPNPQAIFITCVDSRIVASRITQANPGETLMTRNPGSLVPNYNVLHPNTPRPEEAALEYACLFDHVDTIAVCGHSDCKAMNLVFENRRQIYKPAKNEHESVLKTWLMANSVPTIQKYFELEKNDFKKPLKFSISNNQFFEAYIDPENHFANHDKFSQINTLTQLENFKNYPFLKDLMDNKKINAYALWFDIYSGEIYVFCFKEKTFLKLDQSSYDHLIETFKN